MKQTVSVESRQYIIDNWNNGIFLSLKGFIIFNVNIYYHDKLFKNLLVMICTCADHNDHRCVSQTGVQQPVSAPVQLGNPGVTLNPIFPPPPQSPS